MVRAPRLGRHSIHGLVLAVHLLDDAQRSIAAVGAEGQPEARIKTGTIRPAPIGGVAITLSVGISITAIILLSQTAKSFLFLRSIASPDGDSQEPATRAAIPLCLAASISTISLESSRLT